MDASVRALYSRFGLIGAAPLSLIRIVSSRTGTLVETTPNNGASSLRLRPIAPSARRRQVGFFTSSGGHRVLRTDLLNNDRHHSISRRWQLVESLRQRRTGLLLSSGWASRADGAGLN